MSDWQGCLWPTVFSESHVTYFSVFIFITVSNASSSSLHLQHGAQRNKYVRLGIERQFFKMKNAWCGYISSRFSVMLSSTLVFAFRCIVAESWCRGDPSNCQWMGSGALACFLEIFTQERWMGRLHCEHLDCLLPPWACLAMTMVTLGWVLRATSLFVDKHWLQ